METSHATRVIRSKGDRRDSHDEIDQRTISRILVENCGISSPDLFMAEGWNRQTNIVN